MHPHRARLQPHRPVRRETVVEMPRSDAEQLLLLPHLRRRAPQLDARADVLHRARLAGPAYACLGKLRCHEKQTRHTGDDAGDDEAAASELPPPPQHADQYHQHQRAGNPTAPRHAHRHTAQQQQGRVAEQDAYRLADAAGQH